MKIPLPLAHWDLEVSLHNLSSSLAPVSPFKHTDIHADFEIHFEGIETFEDA
jgi:hypothetical protein